MRRRLKLIVLGATGCVPLARMAPRVPRHFKGFQRLGHEVYSVAYQNCSEQILCYLNPFEHGNDRDLFLIEDFVTDNQAHALCRKP